MTLFDNIKKYSKVRGLSLQEVAKKAGLSRNVIYQYGKGVNPTLETLSRIAKVLGVGTNDLIKDTDNEKVKSDSPKHTDLLDKDVILAFDGKDISESEKEKILDYARYVLAQREAKKNK